MFYPVWLNVKRRKAIDNQITHRYYSLNNAQIVPRLGKQQLNLGEQVYGN